MLLVGCGLWGLDNCGAAYNRLAKSSMELRTALERATVAQTLEKEVFLHREFGIRAALFRLTRWWDEMMKSGRAIAARHRMTILSTDFMRDGSALTILLFC